MNQARRLLCEYVAVANQTAEGGQPKDPYCIFHVTSFLCCDVTCPRICLTSALRPVLVPAQLSAVLFKQWMVAGPVQWALNKMLSNHFLASRATRLTCRSIVHPQWDFDEF